MRKRRDAPRVGNGENDRGEGMTEVVRYAREGRTGVIMVDYPPVNALGAAVRAGLLAALDAGLADDGVDALVLTTAGRTFIAGADIREFGKPPQAPVLGDVIARFDASPKPVVAALHGTALGGGLELALGCAFRVALRGTKLGLPEVKLGLLPGAGGTQRLPRLAGVRKALEMITTGDPIAAAEALELGILDAVDDGPSALEAGLRFARRVVEEGLPIRPVRERAERIAGTDPALFSAFRDELAGRARNLFSPFRCVDAVEAAVTLPFDEGLKRARALFLECMDSPQRAGLIHAFFGEREVSKLPGLPADTPTRDVRSVAVIGAGTMGTGIALCFANAGFPVRLLDTSPEALDEGLATIRHDYEGAARKGRLTMADVETRLGLIRPTRSYDDLFNADLVIDTGGEAGGGDSSVATEIFARLGAVCKPGAILATSTAARDLDGLAAATRRPQDVVGLRFGSPADAVRLVEIVRAERTAGDVVATAMALCKRLGKLGVPVRGFVGDRMLERYRREAAAMVDAGASRRQVDAVLTGFGFSEGPFATPFAMGDQSGSDTGRAVSDQEITVSDQEITVSDQEILERCLSALADEGARILEEGIAARALCVDMIWIHGHGFPPYRGGPMFWADRTGLLERPAGEGRSFHGP